MSDPGHCSRCGNALPLEAPEGLCPACLMQQALEESPSTDGDRATETSGTSDPTSPPKSIGPYRLLQKLGEGGMGEVWAAEQSEPVRRVLAFHPIGGSSRFLESPRSGNESNPVLTASAISLRQFGSSISPV